MNKESSAILIHASGVDETRPDFPDTVARQSALAAAELYRQDRENTYLVINAGMHDDTVLSENLANHIRRLLRAETNPEVDDHLIVHNTARDTHNEVLNFKSVSEVNNWDKLYDLGPESQYSRRERAVNRIMPNKIPSENIINAEDVLRNMNEERYSKVIEFVHSTPKYKSFAIYNKGLDIIDGLPLGGAMLNIMSKVVSNESKTAVGKLINQVRNVMHR